MSTTYASADSSTTAVSDFAVLWGSRRPAHAARGPRLLPLASGTGTPLFLLPWTSGNIAFVRDIVDTFRHGHPVYGFEAAGLRDRSEPLLSVADTAERCVQEIRRVQPDGPYLLGGLCGGSQVAYEIASRLAAAGAEVGPVTLVNAARGELADGPRLDLADLYELRLASLRQRFGTDDLVADLGHVMDQMRELHWIDDDMPAQDFFWRQVVWSASMYGFLRCRLRPLDVPVHVFMAQESAQDPEVVWSDIAPRSTLTALDAVTSGQIMQSPAFVSALHAAFSQVSS
ncbi:thioesterase domain-containing protein [Streptomyces sp. NPDC050095]|uniref:thioesterase domain-containing protein n=1 Tax=unclassified Streptomyces TaxID=2593676 RepID=UPI0034334C26